MGASGTDTSASSRASRRSPAEIADGDVFEAAVDLLRELPRERDAVGMARELVAKFQHRFVAWRPELVVDTPPGAPRVDYDLLIDHPHGGTVALNWRAEHTDPWALEYAEHWAANFVLTVELGEDRRLVTTQHALKALRFTADRQPSLMQALVDGALLALEFDENRPVLEPDEIQRGADELRRVLGLNTAEATRHWMDQMQLTPRRFRGIVIDELTVAKGKERIVAPEVERYFADHHADFERVRYTRATTPDPEAGRELAASTRADGGLLAAASKRLVSIARSSESMLSVGIAEAAACELSAPVRAAAPGDVIGPFTENGTSVVAQVLARTPAVLDPATRSLVSARVLREWLDRRAAQATIRWHWM